MSTGIQIPPTGGLVGDGGPRGENSYASDVYLLATAIRATGSFPDLFRHATSIAGELSESGKFGQSIALHVDSTDSREVIASLQLLQLSFDTTAILISARDAKYLTFENVERALEEMSENLVLTGAGFGSLLADFSAYLGDQVTDERILSFMAVFAATIGLVGALATHIPNLIAAAVLIELDALNRFRNALGSQDLTLTSLRKLQAVTTISLQAGPIDHAIIEVEGNSGSRTAFVKFLRKTAVWLPVNRKRVRTAPTGVRDRVIVTLESYGGLTDDQRQQVGQLAASMGLTAEWI